MSQPELSLVIPCFNEEGNLHALVKTIHDAVDPIGVEYEIVITDDCSKDNSWTILKDIAAKDPRLRIQRFEYNCGESAASWAGLQFARGRYLCTIDADLQNDPRDLPKFLEAVKRADCICGTRVEARGKGLGLVGMPSRIAKRPSALFRIGTQKQRVSPPGIVPQVF